MSKLELEGELWLRTLVCNSREVLIDTNKGQVEVLKAIREYIGIDVNKLYYSGGDLVERVRITVEVLGDGGEE